jgi:hypothetical protein
VLASLGTRQSRIRATVARTSKGEHPAFGERENTYRNGSIDGTLSRRRQLANDLPAIGHEQMFASTYFAEVFAQPILQLPNPDSLHAINVAPCGYIVNAAAEEVLRFCAEM